MEKFVIHGGRPLVGEVTISGAKNAAVAILPATILAADKCIIENLPSISDVAVSQDILSAMGARVRVLDKHTAEVDTSHICTTSVPDELSRQMRASYYFLGALLGRFGKGTVAMPGGCYLGPRPIDQHLKAFTALGAEDVVDNGMIEVSAPVLRGEEIFFDTVSVGATINAMLAAVMADGLTVLENVAKEPHIVDVANFLNTMGADVRGAGTDVIKVHGVRRMHGCTYTIIPDQIEAGSYMVGAAITGGNVLIKNVIPKHLEPITSKLEKAGAHVEEYDDSVRVSRTGDIEPLNIKTMPHPGFPTDMQPLMSVLLTLAKGLPNGMDTSIAQGGTNVSGGQRQRLSIARALVKKAPIYIFDDSFSALDFKTDAKLRAALKETTADATVLIVAQRVSTIMHAEQIVVLDEGRIVGIGTHRQLLDSCPEYREIAESQLSKEELA